MCFHTLYRCLDQDRWSCLVAIRGELRYISPTGGAELLFPFPFEGEGGGPHPLRPHYAVTNAANMRKSASRGLWQAVIRLMLRAKNGHDAPDLFPSLPPATRLFGNSFHRIPPRRIVGSGRLTRQRPNQQDQLLREKR